jgi:hypothetical protein
VYFLLQSANFVARHTLAEKRAIKWRDRINDRNDLVGDLVMLGALDKGNRHDHAVGRKSVERLSGSHERSAQLAGYYQLIFRAVSRLEPNTAETRGKIYDLARTAMLLKLRSLIPSLTELDIGREQLTLEEAIKKVETESLHQLGAPTQPSIRMRHRPYPLVEDISVIGAVAKDAGARPTAVLEDEDRASGDPTFARKLALPKPDLSVELEHLQKQIRYHTPRSSVVRKLVPIAIMALLMFAAVAPGAY